VHTPETIRLFLTACLAFPGDRPNNKLISDTVGIDHATGIRWWAEYTESHTVNNRPYEISQDEVDEYFNEVWKRDKHETYLRLRQINDKALDWLDHTAEHRPGDYAANDFQRIANGFQTLIRAQGDIQGQSMGAVKVEHTHKGQISHNVVVLPQLQPGAKPEQLKEQYEVFKQQTAQIAEQHSDSEP